MRRTPVFTLPIIFFLLSCILYSPAIFGQEDHINGVKITNNSRYSKSFYLKPFGFENVADSTFLAPGESAWLKVFSTYPLITLTVQADDRHYYFHKDYGKSVQVEYQPGNKISVQRSALDALWNNIRSQQDAALKVLFQSRTGDLENGSFSYHKNAYENWGFQTFVSLIKVDTFLALRFLNFHLPQLKKVVPLHQSYIDSLVKIVHQMPIAEHPLVVKGNLFENLKDLSYVRLGAPFFHFDFMSTAGDTLNTRAFTNGKLLLDFWASWCKPCREKNREIKRFYEPLKSKGIEVLGISLDNTMVGWTNALENDKLPWPQGLILSGNKTVVQETYNAHAIPLSILFSADGRILKINPSISDLLEQ